MAHACTTIRVYGAKTLSQCVDPLSMFGELARIDVTQSESLKYATVTFFDVRCAQLALEQLGESIASPASAEEQDFRALTASFEALAVNTDFRYFGEVADVRALPNGKLGVEFFDVRALQQALVGVRGSQPLPMNEFLAGVSAHGTPMMLSPPGLDVQQWQGAPTLPENISSDGGSTQDTDEVSKTPKTKVENSSSPKARGMATTEVVAPEDFASLELDLDKIASGEDKRTTVMLRRISKSKTQQDLVTLLVQCGLAGRYTFLYMPYDKRRNSHCRFAFVDFLSAQDVLQLETSLQMFRKLSKAGCGLGVDEQLAVVSYARLQGREQLLQHFGTAAVMHDKDVSRRPQFMDDSMVMVNQPVGTGKEQTKKPPVSTKKGSSLDEPIYIPLPVGAVSSGLLAAA